MPNFRWKLKKYRFSDPYQISQTPFPSLPICPLCLQLKGAFSWIPFSSCHIFAPRPPSPPPPATLPHPTLRNFGPEGWAQLLFCSLKRPLHNVTHTRSFPSSNWTLPTMSLIISFLCNLSPSLFNFKFSASLCICQNLPLLNIFSDLFNPISPFLSLYSVCHCLPTLCRSQHTTIMFVQCSMSFLVIGTGALSRPCPVAPRTENQWLNIKITYSFP